MARAACKIVINGGVRAFAESLERVLISPLVRDKMLPAETCDKLIQLMADLDIAYYSGFSPDQIKTQPHLNGGLVGIAKELEKADVFTSEIWQVFQGGAIQDGKDSSNTAWKDVIE